MNIAIDISPLSSGHKVRGVGFYLQHLKDTLEKDFPKHAYTWFTNTSEIPTNIDIVHYPYFDPFFLTLPLTKKYPTVVTVHDLTPLVFPDKFPSGFKGVLKWRLQRLALQQVNGVITDSQRSREDVIKLVKMKPAKVDVAYLAAGEEFVSLTNREKVKKEMLKKYNLPEKFALYVGDVTWNKNVPNIILSCIQSNIPLVLVGKALGEKNFDGSNPWNADLVLAHELIATSKNVYSLGFVPNEDVVALYNSATMSVFPSRYEGFGLPVVEAMQCGCPVVTSHAGSLAEVAGDSAYIVDPNNLENMKEGFVKVFSDEKLQQSLQKRGFDQARKFSWKKTAEDTIKVYEKVLKKI